MERFLLFVLLFATGLVVCCDGIRVRELEVFSSDYEWKVHGDWKIREVVGSLSNVLKDEGVKLSVCTVGCFMKNDTEKVYFDGVLKLKRSFVPVNLSANMEVDDEGVSHVFYDVDTVYLSSMVKIRGEEFLHALVERVIREKSKHRIVSAFGDDDPRFVENYLVSVSRELERKFYSEKMKKEELFGSVYKEDFESSVDKGIKWFGFVALSPKSAMEIVWKILFSDHDEFVFIKYHFVYHAVVQLVSILIGQPFLLVVVEMVYFAFKFCTRAVPLHPLLVGFKFMSCVGQYSLVSRLDKKQMLLSGCLQLVQAFLLVYPYVVHANLFTNVVCIVVSSFVSVGPVVSQLFYLKKKTKDENLVGFVQYLMLLHALIETFYGMIVIGSVNLVRSFFYEIESPFLFVVVSYVYHLAGVLSGLPSFFRMCRVLNVASIIKMYPEFVSAVNRSGVRYDGLVSGNEKGFIFVDVLLLCGFLYVLGFYLVKSRKLRTKTDFVTCMFLGCVRFATSLEVGLPRNSFDAILVFANVLKYTLLVSNTLLGIVLWVGVWFIGIVMSFLRDSPIVENEFLLIRESAVVSWNDVLDTKKIKVVKDAVCNLQFVFPSRDDFQKRSIGKGIKIARNMLLTLRHVGDPGFAKVQPRSVFVNGVEYPHVNSMYFPKEFGSDGFQVVVVKGDLGFVEKPPFVAESAGSLYYLKKKEEVDVGDCVERVQEYVSDDKKRIMKVKVNTERGDSGTPVVNGLGECLALHGGACGDSEWNYALPFTEDAIRWIEDLMEKNSEGYFDSGQVCKCEDVVEDPNDDIKEMKEEKKEEVKVVDKEVVLDGDPGSVKWNLEDLLKEPSFVSKLDSYVRNRCERLFFQRPFVERRNFRGFNRFGGGGFNSFRPQFVKK